MLGIPFLQKQPLTGSLQNSCSEQVFEKLLSAGLHKFYFVLFIYLFIHLFKILFQFLSKKLQNKCYNQKTYKNFLYNKHLKVKIKAKKE